MLKLPVAAEQVGCVTGPSVGTAGVAGCASIVTEADEPDVQVPFDAVTVYVPSGAVTVPAVFVTPVDGVNV